MPFEDMTKREPSGERRLPASISLRGREGSKRPATIVALTGELVKAAGLKPKEGFSIAFGTGEDAGKMRLTQKREGGLITPRLLKHAYLLDLGYVARFGNAPCPKVMTDARMISHGVVEVDIPDFASAIKAAVEEEEDDEEPARPPRPAAPAAAGGDMVGDIRFDRAAVRITRNGRHVDATARQLDFVHALAKAKGGPVGIKWLCDKLWDKNPPASAMGMLSNMYSDLLKPLDGLGLVLNHVRGVGYQLKVK